MASGFSGGTGGGFSGVAGFSPAVSSWYFGSLGTDTLGGFIREAQLDDFLYSFGAREPRVRGIPITTSRDLPGSTHWDPAPVPVGKTNGGSGGGENGIQFPGIPLPAVDIFGGRPDVLDEGQPPIIYSPPPILLPGQVDPGREEKEAEEGDMAHTWTHVGSQLVGAIFGQNQVATGLAFADPGTLGPFDPGVPAAAVNGVPAVYSGGTCPPMKTRTLTIDCATGLEVKRKRRRRPKLLTNGDMGTLFQIGSLPNNANVRIALAGAIRR